MRPTTVGTMFTELHAESKTSKKNAPALAWTSRAKRSKVPRLPSPVDKSISEIRRQYKSPRQGTVDLSVEAIAQPN